MVKKIKLKIKEFLVQFFMLIMKKELKVAKIVKKAIKMAEKQI